MALARPMRSWLLAAAVAVACLVPVSHLGAQGADEQATIDRLGRAALAFLDSADSGQGGSVGQYEAIAGPLERSYEYHRQALDRMSQDVIDRDGDMDAMA